MYWCTADIGWITGHSYIVYGPLANGATTVLFEGIPSYPDFSRFWDVIDKHKITQLYTAPTAIRALAKERLDYVTSHDLSSLRILGTVGEPINEEAWHWYNNHIGKKNSPFQFRQHLLQHLERDRVGMGDTDGIALALGPFYEQLELFFHKPTGLLVVDEDIPLGKGHLKQLCR